MMDLPIRTNRLVLRPFREGDLDAFLAYRNDPDVARYQYWDGISTAEAIAFIRKNAGSALGKPGQWQQIGIALGAEDRLVGDIGLYLRDGRCSAELGFSLARQYQGRGIAREALTALINALFDQPELERLEAVSDMRNGSAMALLTWLGFKVESTAEAIFKGSPCQERTYSLARMAWRTA